MKVKTFWIVIFIIGSGVRSTELFHPIDRNEWRESDMASIARNYYRNGMDFPHPQIDWDGSGPGYTESEFPLYPYLIALSYKLFGIWEPIGRIISYLFSLITMIVFFRLSKHLFDLKTSFAVSFFFSLSPLLMVTSNSVQPESMMFFFYICSAFSFILWVKNQSAKFYILTIVFTAFALLCKITAINIGILFAFYLIIEKGLRFLMKPKVIFLAILCTMPAIVWYSYSHKFYLHYGNSLGISNEYAWIGWDFFSNPYFIKGIIIQELTHVWTYSGPAILVLALISTKIVKNPVIIIPVIWLVTACLFYFICSRTTADSWAFYYHIFTVPAASMLLGISIIEIYQRYFRIIKHKIKSTRSKLYLVKNSIVASLLILLAISYLALSFKYLIYTKPSIYMKSDNYLCKDVLENKIPQSSIILATGGPSRDIDNYPLAFNASYFFYWIDRKGYNICIEEQSPDKVLKFKEKGAEYYIAEAIAMRKKQGFEEIMRKKFNVILECNGVVLFKLNN